MSSPGASHRRASVHRAIAALWSARAELALVLDLDAVPSEKLDAHRALTEIDAALDRLDTFSRLLRHREPTSA